MTNLGLLLPVFLLVTGIGEAVVFGYLRQRGAMREAVANGLILLALLLPLVAYVFLNFLFPDLGAITIL